MLLVAAFVRSHGEVDVALHGRSHETFRPGEFFMTERG